jgi:diguanylate cyclase (GGDEF)-like protein/PAS domain S-box-containing protein
MDGFSPEALPPPIPYAELVEILESSPDYVATCDGNGRVLWSNATCRALFDVASVDDYATRRVDLFRYFSPPSRARFLDEAIPELFSNGAWMGEIEAQFPDGSTLPMSFVATTHYGDDGYPRYFSGIGREISAMKAAERALAASEMRMRTLVNSSPIGIFETNAWGACTYVNPKFCEVAGITDPSDALGFGWGRVLHPDDAGAAGSAWAVAIKTDSPFTGHFRFVGGDGPEARTEVWADVKAVPIHDEHGTTTMFLGTIDDITERLALERARFESAELFRTAFDNAPNGMTLTGIDGPPIIVRANQAYADLIGRPLDELVGMNLLEVTNHDDAPGAAAGRDALIRGEVSNHKMEIQHHRPDGTVVWCELTRSIVRDSEDRPKYVMSQITDITAERTSRLEVERMAFSDALTGLPNRRSFLAELDRCCAVRHGRDGTVALLFVDLDHFKTVNDKLGHDAGDELLVAVAAGLRSAVRGGDMVARLGGDEFAVVINDVTAEGMQLISQRLAERLHFPRTLPDGTVVTVTASIGLAWAHGDETLDEFLRRADLAMYQAKHRGRNQIVDAETLLDA